MQCHVSSSKRKVAAIITAYPDTKISQSVSECHAGALVLALVTASNRTDDHHDCDAAQGVRIQSELEV